MNREERRRRGSSVTAAAAAPAGVSGAGRPVVRAGFAPVGEPVAGSVIESGASVGDSVGASVGDSVGGSVGDSDGDRGAVRPAPGSAVSAFVESVGGRAERRRVPGAAGAPVGESAGGGEGIRPIAPIALAEPAPGLYVHIPFCRRICPYCDFAVTPLGGAEAGARRFEAYRKALLAELRLRAAMPPFGANAGNGLPPADTVYFGGGTPSLAPPGFFAEVLATAADLGLTTPSPWAALEANPEDLAPDGTAAPAGAEGGAAGERAAADRARQWVAEGIRGVSLGAQSLRESRLRFLGRAHSPAAARRAVARSAEAGLEWISLDLIYGAAGDRPEDLGDELREAASLPGLTHLSAYELTVEPGTAFGRRAAAGERLRRPDDEGGDLFRLVHRTLADCGLPAYEASNFARGPGGRSRHNPKYWLGAPYLGLGPSAHSFLADETVVGATPRTEAARPRPTRRSWNRRGLGEWREALAAGRLPTAGAETVPPAGRALEEAFLRLRTADGLDLAGFAARHGEEVVEANRARFRRWRERGLVSFPGGAGETVLRPTLEGLAVADALAAEMDLGALAGTRREPGTAAASPARPPAASRPTAPGPPAASTPRAASAPPVSPAPPAAPALSAVPAPPAGFAPPAVSARPAASAPPARSASSPASALSAVPAPPAAFTPPTAAVLLASSAPPVAPASPAASAPPASSTPPVAPLPAASGSPPAACAPPARSAPPPASVLPVSSAPPTPAVRPDPPARSRSTVLRPAPGPPTPHPPAPLPRPAPAPSAAVPGIPA